MVTKLKYGSKKEDIKKMLDRLSRNTEKTGVNAYKYCGVISIVEDPLDIQSNLRDEWK